ncbi:MAG: VCBS repeat-containing protein [Candidatus Omnitrophica bacterium]|nr:VCBS repeat-containing protein [Candidatus Omnitrophota bacterium]
MRHFFILGIIVSALCGEGLKALAGDAWIENSFEDFSDGTFGDGGANTYVSAKGRIQTVNRFDVNNDSYIDILNVNSHPLVEMLDLSIYWGNGKDFSIQNHCYIPVNGPMWVTPHDLNKDGNMDLVVSNFSNGTWTQMDSAVYWGAGEKEATAEGVEGWAFGPFNGRTFLPSQNCQNAAIGDFNKDGWDDIVFALAGGFWEYRDPNAVGAPSKIYWNREGNFDREDFTDVDALGPTDVATADLDGDGWLDLVFSNADKGSASFIYYGGKDGFAESRLAKLPTNKPSSVEISDVNNDGSMDIVFANEGGEESYAYLNDGGEFSGDNRIAFETYNSKDSAVADFNQDGYADVFFTNHQYSFSGDPNLANRMIVSYLYFGSADGFSKENRQEFQTIGAWGAKAADLNEDGWIDLFVNNFQEHYSYEVPSFIYWNGPDGFSLTNRTPIYEHGAQGNAVADFDGDGHVDLAVTSMMGRSRGDYDPCHLYFGDENGHYSKDNRIEFMGREAYEQAFADIDDDGQVDVLIINQGEITRLANELQIFWNDNNQFDPWKKTGISVYKGLAVQVGDLDKDGYLDLITCNYYPVPGAEGIQPGMLIYWGSAEGYVTTQRTSVPIDKTRDPTIVDINGDGHLDLVCGQERKDKTVDAVASIFFGDGTRNYSNDRREYITGSEDTGTPEVADLNKDGFLDIAFAGEELKVFYGNKDARFSKENSEVLDVKAKTTNIGDVDGDGWLDILCPYYKGGGRRSWFSSILLGGPEGFDEDRRIELPTDGGAGGLISDFNFDGYTDVFFWCHRRDGSTDEVGVFGDHFTNSFLYFNGPAGFNVENREEIPSQGVHYDTGTDIGNIRDRSYRFDYISSAHNCGGKSPASISWVGQTPGLTSLKFQIRTADSEDGLKDAKWHGPGGVGTYFTDSGTPLDFEEAPEWIQYRAILDTENGAASPILSSVEIDFE